MAGWDCTYSGRRPFLSQALSSRLSCSRRRDPRWRTTRKQIPTLFSGRNLDGAHGYQGSRFIVGREGATLGRKQTNTIAFSHESNGTIMGIDASISGDHARIAYDEPGDYLYIMDGTPSKVGWIGRRARAHSERQVGRQANRRSRVVARAELSSHLEAEPLITIAAPAGSFMAHGLL